MLYTTRKTARDTAQAINALYPELVKAPTTKSVTGWRITFKRGTLTRKNK